MKPRTIFRLVLVVILVALFVRNYMLTRQVDRSRTRPTQSEARTFDRSTRDLSRDDLLGGHTLKRHVAKTDDDLRARLSQEHISAASTYTDRAIAERTVTSALKQNEDKLRNWVNQRGGHQNLVLDYDSPAPIGRTLSRGASSATSCSHAVVVLKHIEAAASALPLDDSFFVLTSYPQCGAGEQSLE
jgi:hypothetical protein